MTPTDDVTLRFSCPRCLLRLKARPEAAGSRCLCPRCQFFFEVPRKSRSSSVEAYPLRQSDAPPAARQVQVLVVCPACHTRMYGALDQVGQSIECPDCGTPTVVPPPSPDAAKKKFRSAAEVGDYQLSTEAERTAEKTPAAEARYIPVVCPVCNTRMHASIDQVGEKMTCPDCGTESIVPPAPSPPHKVDPMAGAGSGYHVINRDPPAVSQEVPPPADDDAAVNELIGEPLAAPQELTPLPRLPLLVGTFSFPFSRNSLSQTIILAVWMMFVLGMLMISGFAITGVGARVLFGGAILGAFTLILLLMWFSFASACALTIVRDTANGCDEVQDWPGALFLDWMGEVFFVFNALAFSIAPSAFIAWLLSLYEQTGAILVLASLYVFFPLILLSMLEQNSPFAIFSPPIWKTLFSSFTTWTTFFLTSAILFLLFGIIENVAFRLGMVFGVIPLGAYLAVAWMIYFRLLGRLGRVCLERAADRSRDDDEYDDEEGGEDDEE